ncbi:hypothetical protein H5410_063342, partial [Solanum commersonii]
MRVSTFLMFRVASSIMFILLRDMLIFADYHLALKSLGDLLNNVTSAKGFLFSFVFLKSRIPELFDYQFINQKVISIDLKPSWYTDKFMGFSLCYCPVLEANVSLIATLVCKSDPERKHSLKYVVCEYCPKLPSSMELCWGIRLEYENKVGRSIKKDFTSY